MKTDTFVPAGEKSDPDRPGCVPPSSRNHGAPPGDGPDTHHRPRLYGPPPHARSSLPRERGLQSTPGLGRPCQVESAPSARTARWHPCPHAPRADETSPPWQRCAPGTTALPARASRAIQVSGSGEGREWDGSRPVSRVLSRAAIHLGRASPRASCDLPGSGAGRACRSPIWSCSGWGLPCHRCYHRRGALLPHLFTLTRARRAVCFLWHFPWARAPQALPGTLPCGARTFLPAARRGAAAARPTPAAPVSASRCRSATEERAQSGISRSREIPL